MNSLRYAIKLAILSVFFLVFLGAGCAKAPSAPAIPVQPSDNELPVISEISFPGDVMALTENLITCTANDTDGDDLTYVWTAQDGTIKGEGAGIVWVAPGSVGKYDIKVVVRDGKGGEVMESITIRVVTNADGSTNPLITLKLSLVPGETVVEEGRARIWTTTDILCQVGGDNESGLTYTWSATEGKLQGEELADGTATRVSWVAPGAAGGYTVTVKVTDSTGRVTTGEVHFTVFCCTDT